MKYHREGNIRLGDNVRVSEFSSIRTGENDDCEITIGDNTIIGPNTTIVGRNHGFRRKDKLIKDQPFEDKGVVIGSDVWIGANAVVLPGVTIGDGAVVGAGSIVTHDVAKHEVWAGNPAKKIGERK